MVESRGSSPDPSNSTGSFDEFREDVQSKQSFVTESCSIGDSLDLLEVTGVGVAFCNHNVQIKQRVQPSDWVIDKEFSNERRKRLLFDFFFYWFFYIAIKQIHLLFQFFFEQLTESFAHLIRSSFEFRNINIVTSWCNISNDIFFSISNTLNKGEIAFEKLKFVGIPLTFLWFSFAQG